MTPADYTALEQEIEAACADAVYPYWLAGPLPAELTPWVEERELTIDDIIDAFERGEYGDE